MSRPVISCLALAVAVAMPSAFAGNAPPPDHPLIGTWRLAVPGGTCAETYRLGADGRARITSGREVAVSAFSLSPTPGASGLYRWEDRIVRDNGQPDCLGAVTAVGHVAVNFVRLDPAGDRFDLCATDAATDCVGPFVRQPDRSAHGAPAATHGQRRI